jgi:hypothetical protein
MNLASIAILSLAASATAFTPLGKTSTKTPPKAVSVSNENGKSIFDPLGLYPKNSPERKNGMIKPLESSLGKDETVIDPLFLYQNKKEITISADMSASVPFLPRPTMLDGSLPGDRGFDPFNFSSDSSALAWNRESEIRHARIAMLAVVGWPLAELFHKTIASNFDLQPILAQAGKVPSVLNGGLSLTSPLFWVAAISATAALEFISTKNQFKEPGDFGFDPLGLGGETDKQKFFMKEAELFNGRLAMLAITGFAIQEFFSNTSVINQTPIFFKPFWDVVSQLLESGAAGTSL